MGRADAFTTFTSTGKCSRLGVIVWIAMARIPPLPPSDYRFILGQIYKSRLIRKTSSLINIRSMLRIRQSEEHLRLKTISQSPANAVKTPLTD